MNKAVVYCAVVAVVVLTIVNAYNFDDEEFNQILARDLEELHNSVYTVSHVRDRRDEEAVIMKEKCRPRRKKLCCAEAVMDELHESDKEVKKVCFKEAMLKNKQDKDEKVEPSGEFDPFRCDKAKDYRKQMLCVMQCVGQKKNMVDSAGNPMEEEFASFVKETFAKESWFSSLQDKVISTCLAEARNATSNRGDASDTESCNPAGAKLAHCMFREIQLNCPADQIKDQKSCARLQERLKKHNDFYPPPPPPPFMNDE